MTNNSYTCPIGVNIIISFYYRFGGIKFIKVGETTVDIGTTEGPCEVVIKGKTRGKTVRAIFEITFVFPTEESFNKKKCFLTGMASFIDTSKIEYLEGEEEPPEPSKIKEQITFDSSKGKWSGKPYCTGKEFKLDPYHDEFTHGNRKVILDGELKVIVDCLQKKKKKGKYLKNKRTGEVHDLKNIKGSCNIDQMNDKNKEYLSSIEKGSNGCYHCLRKYDTG